MNVSSLIKQYFTSDGNDVTIDVFDEKNIYSVYKRVVGVLTKNMTIETTVLQGMSYCFYEILDNVLTHSEKEMGTVITQYNTSEHSLAFLVADDGRGIQASLSENNDYANIIMSVEKSDFWQGTIVYVRLRTNKGIDPAEVVSRRTYIANQYNESFLNDSGIEELW